MNNNYKCIWIASIIQMFCFINPTYAMDENIQLHIQSLHDAYSLGEPVQLVLTFDNRSITEKQVDLGANGIANLHVTIIKDGLSKGIDGRVPAGLSEPVSLKLPSKTTSIAHIFVDDFFRPSVTGVYEVAVRISNTEISSDTAMFEISSDTNITRKRLEGRYAELAVKIQSEGTTYPGNDNFRKTIVLSRNPAALELQEQLALKREWSYAECRQIVEALVASKSPNSIQILVQSILKCPDASEFEKTAVLNAMRVANAKDWEGELLVLIEPYLQDIESSIPMVVSD